MNAIFEKSRTKRKYTRKAMCANKDGVCDFLHCRCGYANILDKIAKNSIKRGIDEDLHHREKVIKRRREIELRKLDEENTNTPQNTIDSMMNYFSIQGEYSKRKALKAKYKRMWWNILFILMGIVLLTSLIM